MKTILDEVTLNYQRYFIFDIPATKRMLQFNDPWMIGYPTTKYYLSLPRMRFMASMASSSHMVGCFLDEEGTYPLILPNVYGRGICLGSAGFGVENKLGNFFNAAFTLCAGANFNSFLELKLKIRQINLLKKNHCELLKDWEEKSRQNKFYNFIDDNRITLKTMTTDCYYPLSVRGNDQYTKILKKYFF